MGKLSKDSTAETVEASGFEGRYGETDGYTIGFERYTEHSDMTPLFAGLPDDRCQSPHWGYVFKGKLVYHTADGDIEITDGEAYSWVRATRPRSSPTPKSSSSARRRSSTRRWRSSPRTCRGEQGTAGPRLQLAADHGCDRCRWRDTSA